METQDIAIKKKRIIIIVASVLILATALILFFYYRSKITATTMRILRLEGTVSLEDDGQSKPVRENLRLNSGNALSTAVKSLVAIGLDDVKIVTLDELSRAEFNQSGRKLDLHLTDGSLFFEVQKSLEDDESFEIKTSTMVVGIRGTSGWVSVEGDHESLIITDGHVHVIGTNPVTGEKKEIDVYAGQKVSTYLYNDRKVDSIMFYVEQVTERDLPEFLLNRLRENPALLDKVCRETGWDKPWIMGIAVDTDDLTPAPSDEKSHDKDDDIEPTPAPVEEEPVAEAPKTGGLTKSELANAKSMIIAIDASTGIVALSDGTLFDPAWYIEAYPEVAAKYGTSIEALVAQYIKSGKKEGKLPLRPVLTTPAPTPTWVSEVNDNNDDDDDDDDDDGNNQGQQNQQQINVAYGPDANGNYDVTLENGTARLTNYGGNLEIIGTDSNGRVKIPFEIKDTNGQHLAGDFSGGYVKFRTNNVQYIDATEYDHPSMFGGTIDEAKKAGNDVFTISNGTTTVNVDTNSSNAPTANITPGAKGASNLKDALDYSIPSYPNSFSNVDYGSVSISYNQNSNEYTVTDSNKSFTFNKNTTYINTDGNNNVVVKDWGGNVIGTIKPDGTIQ